MWLSQGHWGQRLSVGVSKVFFLNLNFLLVNLNPATPRRDFMSPSHTADTLTLEEDSVIDFHCQRDSQLWEVRGVTSYLEDRNVTMQEGWGHQCELSNGSGPGAPVSSRGQCVRTWPKSEMSPFSVLAL